MEQEQRSGIKKIIEQILHEYKIGHLFIFYINSTKKIQTKKQCCSMKSIPLFLRKKKL